MARELGTVIDQILEVIPDSECDLRGDLGAIKDSDIFCPPEGVAGLWRRTMAVLNEAIGEPSEPWQHEVKDIFNNKIG